ncbi:MAG: hypothetical protein OHK0040_00950 [bacterium]
MKIAENLTEGLKYIFNNICGKIQQMVKWLLLPILLMPSLIFAQTCSLTNISDVNFGLYDVANATPTDTMGSATLTCTANINATITLSSGLYANNFTSRYMKNQIFGDLLAYNLFTNVNRTSIWGDGTGGSSSVTIRVNRNKPPTLTIYARIYAQQNVSIGNYSDTVIITVLP